MLRSLRTAETAMHMHKLRVETLANNLANVNSIGFKQVMARIVQQNVSRSPQPEEARSEQSAGTDQLPSALDRTPTRRTESEIWRPLPPMLTQIAMDTRPGPLRPTGNPTDLAIIGEGYFVVGDDENEYFTRNGSFQLNENRELVTSAGLKVKGTGGSIKIDGASFDVSRDGTVVVDGNIVGRLQVVRFDDSSSLLHAGNSLLKAPTDLGYAEVEKGGVDIVQGQVEGSNVDPVRTLIDMIAAQRAFEFEAKVMQANDETLDKSVNQLGRKA